MTILIAIAGYAFFATMLLGLVCIALAERGIPVGEDQHTPELPYLPPPVITLMSLDARIDAAYRRVDQRARWEAQQEVEYLVHQVERGIAI